MVCMTAETTARKRAERVDGLWTRTMESVSRCGETAAGRVTWTSAPSEYLAEPTHGLVGLGIGGHALGGPLARVQHRGVVAAAERPADRGQRLVRELAREVHGDLARPRDGAGAAARTAAPRRTRRRRRRCCSWMARTLGRAGLRLGVEAGEHLLGELGGDRPAGERGEGDDADERSLERPDVVRDAVGDAPRGRRARRRRSRPAGRACAGWSAAWCGRARRRRTAARPRSARAGGPRARSCRAAGGPR